MENFLFASKISIKTKTIIMKKAFLAIVLAFLATEVKAHFPCNDCLMLHGRIVSTDRATIKYFVQTDSSTWDQFGEVHNKKRYSVHLDPEKTYRIEFMNERTGVVKTLIVHGGRTGSYHEIVDVNFMKSDISVAHIKQMNSDRYTLPINGDGFNH